MKFEKQILQIGKEFKAERVKRGDSIRSVARVIGITHGQLSGIEKGRYNMRLSTLLALKKYIDLGRSIRSFRGGAA